MKLGYVGLGKMGLNMVARLLEKGHEVVAWNRSPEPREEAEKLGAQVVERIEDIAKQLEPPRVVWLMLPAGEVTEEKLNELVPHLEREDLVIEGANSFYKDSLRRAKMLSEHGIRFMDVGVSGGPRGAREGACLMIGGAREDFESMEPLFRDIAAPNAYQHLGPVGAGHFAKMVHNGVEYGMMEAIAEGAAVLEASDFNFDLRKVFDVYNHRSVIESRLVGWAKSALEEYPGLEDIKEEISHSGEGEWTVKTAKELGIPVPIIEESFQVRVRSGKEPKENPKASFRNRMVSALRGQFGGHDVKKT